MMAPTDKNFIAYFINQSLITMTPMVISKETRLDELSKTLPATAGFLLHGDPAGLIDATPVSRTLANMAAMHGISEAQIETFVFGLNAMLLEKDIMPPRYRN